MNNREIKFRAWDGKKMVDTGAYHLCDPGKVKMWDGEKHEYLDLMQYTGLKDRNGREIYEGDIIGSETGAVRNWIVKWINEWGKYVLISQKKPEGTDIANSIQRAPRMAIIGNCYENPELLK